MELFLRKNSPWKTKTWFLNCMEEDKIRLLKIAYVKNYCHQTPLKVENINFGGFSMGKKPRSGIEHLYSYLGFSSLRF